MLPLGLRTTSTLSADKQFIAILSKLSQEEMGRYVKRVVREKGVSIDLADTYRVQFLRFFALAVHLQLNLAPTKAIDIFWHEFILYTRPYTEFCTRHCGFYFHHEPFDDETSSKDISETFNADLVIDQHFTRLDLLQDDAAHKCASGQRR